MTQTKINGRYRWLFQHNGKDLWLSWRCFVLLEKITRAQVWIGYDSLKESREDRIETVMYQLRGQLKAQGGPEIESRRHGHHSAFRVKV